MTDRPWPKTARVIRIVGAIVAAVGLIAGIVGWLFVGSIEAGLPGLVALIAGAAAFIYAYTYYPQHPDRASDYDSHGDGFVS